VAKCGCNRFFLANAHTGSNVVLHIFPASFSAVFLNDVGITCLHFFYRPFKIEIKTQANEAKDFKLFEP